MRARPRRLRHIRRAYPGAIISNANVFLGISFRVCNKLHTLPNLIGGRVRNTDWPWVTGDPRPITHLGRLPSPLFVSYRVCNKLHTLLLLRQIRISKS